METITLPLRIRGMLQDLVLYTLREGPLHGYGITYRIYKLLDGAYRPSPGALYPALALLRERGLIKFRQEGRKRVYSLTSEGLKELDKRKDEIEEFIRRIRISIKIIREIGIIELLKAIWDVSAKRCDEDLSRETLERARRLVSLAKELILKL